MEYRQELKKCLDLLKKDSIIIFKTDTIYGFHSLAKRDLAKKINKLKKSDEDKPLIELYTKELLKEMNLDDRILNLWPSPLTIIININTEGKAIRCPGKKFIIDLINSLKEPIYSTSVNYSSLEPLNDINKIKELFLSKVDYILEDKEESEENLKSSTIIDLREKPYKIIRGEDSNLPSWIKENL